MAPQRIPPWSDTQLQEALQYYLGHDQAKVYPYGRHLIVKLHVGNDIYPIARLTFLGRQQYGLSYRTSNDKWSPMPFSGSIDDMASVIAATLGPDLDPANYAFL